MADVIRTLGPAGGSPDYTSMVSWEAIEQTDLVADGDTHTLLVRTMTLEEQVTIDWPDGNDTYNLTIEPDTGHHHGGVQGAGFVWDYTDVWSRGVINTAYVTIKGITGTGDNFNVFMPGASNVTFDECLVDWDADVFNDNGSISLFAGNLNLTIRNCVLRSTRAAGNAYMLNLIAADDSTVLDNNTFYLTGADDAGIRVDSATDTTAALLRNNVFLSTGTGGNVVRWWNGDTIAGDCFTNPLNTNNRMLVGHDTFGTASAADLSASDFENMVGLDFTPTTGGNAYQTGADLSTDFVTDVTGATRSAWSAGAYDGESVSPPGTGWPTPKGYLQLSDTAAVEAINMALAAPVASGDLIILVEAPHRADRQSTSVVSDNGRAFTRIAQSTATTSVPSGGSVWVLFSDGTETSIDLTYSGSARHTVSQAIYSNTDSVDVVAQDDTNITTIVQSQDTGLASPTTPTGTAVYFFVGGNGLGWNPVFDVSSGTLQLSPDSGNSYFTSALSDEQYSDSADKGATFSSPGDTGSQAWGCVVLLAPSAGGTAPAVTEDPASQTASVGSTATFTSAATGDPAPSPQWERNTGSGFADVPGATSPSYTTGVLALGDSGDTFRCRWSNSEGDATSAEATLTVIEAVSAMSLIGAINVEGATEAYSAMFYTAPFAVIEQDLSSERLAWSAPSNGTLRDLLVHIDNNTDGDLTFCWFEDDSGTPAETGLCVTIPPTTGPEWFRAGPLLEHTVLENDLLWLGNSGTTATSGTYTPHAIYSVFIPDDAVCYSVLGADSPGSTNNNTDDAPFYLNAFGERDGADQAEYEKTIFIDGSIVHPSMSTGTVARTTDTSAEVTIDGVTQAFSLNFPAGSSTNIIVVDEVNEVPVSAGQAYGFISRNGTGASEAFNVEKYVSSLRSISGQFMMTAANNGAGYTVLDGNTYFINPMAYLSVGFVATYDQAALVMPDLFGIDLDERVIEVGQSNQTTPTTFTLYKNGEATSVSTVISSGTTGLVPVDASSVQLNSLDTVAIQISAAAGAGQLRLKQIGITGRPFASPPASTQVREMYIKDNGSFVVSVPNVIVNGQWQEPTC